MTELILKLLAAGFTATFEGGETAGLYYCLLRDMATGELANCVVADDPDGALLAAVAWATDDGVLQGDGTRPDRSAQRVKLTVTGDCGHVIWTGFDSIEEKYPFYCDECGEECSQRKYPWKLASEIVTA